MIALGAVLAAFAAPAWAAARWKRREGAGGVETSAFALAGSVSVAPALWAVSTMVGLGPLSALLAAAITAGLILLAAPRAPAETPAAPPWRPLVAIALAAVALAAVAFAPQGMQRGDGVHRVAMHDWQKHLLVTSELASAAAVPPANPFLPASGSTPYYAGFHLLAATITQAVGSPTAAYAALQLLTLVTLLLVPLTAYVLTNGIFRDTRTAILAAAGATLLAGFDIAVLALDSVIAAATEWSGEITFAGLRELVPSTHLDYWIPHVDRQLNSPLMTALWAPQHLLAACLAVLCLHQLLRRGLRHWRDVLPVVPLLAAIPLLSAYVGMVLAASLAGVWLTLATAKERIRWIVLAGGATVLLLPFIRGLLGGSSPPLELRLSPAGGWTNGALFTAVLGDGTVARLLDTPLLLMIEFGLVGALGVVGARRHLAEHDDNYATRLVGIAALTTVFAVLVRPPLGEPNNVYARGLLLVWFILAAFGAHEWRRCARAGVVRSAVAICLLGTLFTPVGLLLEGVAFRSTPIDAIATIEQLHAVTPPETLVAIPEGALSSRAFFLRRRLLAYDERHARLFGAPQGAYEATAAALGAALTTPEADGAARMLRALDVDVLLSPRQALQSTWQGSPCLPVVAHSGDWVALGVVSDCED